MKFVVVLCGGASLLAIAPAAFAQQTAPAATAPASLDTVVVTGSRIVRNGYAAPTPVTVASVAQLQTSTPTNVSDALNKLPVFDGSQQGAAGQAFSGGANVSNVPGNYLNLRDMGPIRTLVLIGGLTDVCVHYTFADAHQRDFYVRVVEDCVGGSSEARHLASLDAMEYLQAGARRSTQEILDAFAALAAGRALTATGAAR